MRKILLLGVIAATVFSSCSTSSRGELVGVQELSEFYPTDPYGMVKIARGTFTMGANDGDVPYAHTTPKKLVTMHSFYMDQTEITNKRVPSVRSLGERLHCQNTPCGSYG